jgi:hypothetical protein
MKQDPGVFIGHMLESIGIQEELEWSERNWNNKGNPVRYHK